jgi:signal transduction histidine kinase
VTNLPDNAADAMGGPGEISIRCADRCRRGERHDLRYRSGDPAGDGACCSSPFHHRRWACTGLGLHLSHNIVVRHGGAIEVESEPGRTCFEVTLPLTLPAIAAVD